MERAAGMGANLAPDAAPLPPPPTGQIDRERNQREMTGQEIERGSLAHVLLFASPRAPSACVPRPLGCLLRRPPAPALLLLHADRPRWLRSLGDSDRPRRNTAKLLRQIRRCSRLPPRQIRSLKASRQEGGEGLLPAVSGGVSGSVISPLWGPSIVVQARLISSRWIGDTGSYPLVLSPRSSSRPEDVAAPQRGTLGREGGHSLRRWTSVVQAGPPFVCLCSLEGLQLWSEHATPNWKIGLLRQLR